MADNTTLNAATGGDTIRDVAKTANSPAKTQVVLLDIGGGADGSPETIASAANPLPSGVYDSTGIGINSVPFGTGVNCLLTALGATDFIISTVNSSVAQLAAGASFIAPLEAIPSTANASVDIVSDQPGILIVNQYITANTNSLCASATLACVPTQGLYCLARAFTVNGNYLSLTFQNTGAAATTLLNINTAYGTIMPTTQLLNTPVALDEVSGVALNMGSQSVALSLPVVENSGALPALLAIEQTNMVPLLMAILTELRVANHMLREGLNVRDDTDALRGDPYFNASTIQ
jgi:hypothetical protein